MVNPSKKCSKCGVEQPLADFHKEVSRRDGRRADCKLCNRARRRDYYARNPDKEKAIRDAWRAQNPEYAANWAKDNQERLRLLNASYYQANKEKHRERTYRWREANRERTREIDLACYRRRQATPKGRLDHAVSAIVWRSLKRAKAGRGTFELLGYTLTELMTHLERQFVNGMDWQNYGEWHVDHVLPLSSFDYHTPEDPDFRAAWALTNLRPMWAEQNLSKGAKRLTLL